MTFFTCNHTLLTLFAVCTCKSVVHAFMIKLPITSPFHKIHFYLFCRNIEDILAEKGETVKRVLDSDSQEYFIEVEKSDEDEHGQITNNNTENKKT